MSNLISIPMQVLDTDLFDAVIGCDFANCEFLKSVTINEDDLSLEVVMTDKDDDDKEVTEIITISGLALAYGKILSEGQLHCGHYTFDLDDADACFAEFLLQYAVYGELVFR